MAPGTAVSAARMSRHQSNSEVLAYMLVTQNQTRQVLRQIVFKLTPDLALRQDLTQEALLHLWLREQQCPGQSHSWYFQSCRFFLQNFMRNGRSVDSARH